MQEDIDRGSIVEQPVPGATRNRLQTFTLLRVLEENRYDAVFGGGRRDEEKARAKERVFSLRDEFGQWDPRAQRPELWNLYNTRHRPGEHFRVFPLSNWTELDIWQYVDEQKLELSRDLLRPQAARSSAAPACCSRSGPGLSPATGVASEQPFETTVRYRTVGDMTCTAAVESTASTPAEVIVETAVDESEREGRHARRRPVLGRRHGGPQAGGLLLVELLRFATGGSVDDGKSTLIGRLLYDSKQVFEDQLEAVERTSVARGDEYVEPRPAHRRAPGRARAGHHDRRRLPLLLDAETQVHHRRHARAHPAHPQHGHGLLDRRPRPAARSTPAPGPTEQTRRHAMIASLLGIRHLVLCVNKMDLVGYSKERFEEIRRRVHRVLRAPRGRRPHLHPDLGAGGRQRRGAFDRDGLVRRALAAATTSRPCTSPRTAT